MSTRTLITCITILAAAVLAPTAAADPAAQTLPFGQAWSNASLISADDDWSKVPGVAGYRGDGLAARAGQDPQTILADGSATPLDVNANENNPASLFTGGLAEFQLADPVVALQPSGVADAPHLLLVLDTRGFRDIDISYLLRDIDPSSDNAVQAIALQYRVGSTGPFTNVRAGFVADATTGPRLAGRTTGVRARLPEGAGNRPLVQVRIIAADAIASDEWVGIDDVAVVGTSISEAPPVLSVAIAARKPLARTLARGLRPLVRVDEACTVSAKVRISRRLAQELEIPRVVARGTITMTEAGQARLIATFTAEARLELAPLSSVPVTLITIARDAAGGTSKVFKRILLVR
jgi:hypothetical protein